MTLWRNKIKPDYIPDINEEDKYDLQFFDRDVTNLAAKESFINDEEKEKILNKVKAYSDQFQEIAKNYK